MDVGHLARFLHAIQPSMEQPKCWHRRAEEARTIAETMNNIDARAGMLRLAADYEAMAQRAEEWSAETERRSGALTENRSHFIKDATPSAP